MVINYEKCHISKFLMLIVVRGTHKKGEIKGMKIYTLFFTVT
jgi:hypothetical protein